jgi:Tol biopolymer transport system component/DNA-binding winged helix-turn-helix (wHTH) protein
VVLQDLALRLLGILARHPGQVVTRDEIQRQLWPEKSFADFEAGLNTAMRKVRQALNDDPREPRAIETIRGYGYRLLIPVELAERSASIQAVAAQAGIDANRSPNAPKRAHRRWAVACAAVSLVAALFALWWLTPLPPPAVADIIPITTRGRVDTCWPPESDGGRLFYLERAGDRWNLMQTSIVGGDPQPVPNPFANNMIVLDVSPDHGQLLVGTFDQRDEPRAIYTMPVQGGPPVRLGDIVAGEAKWSPRGDLIAFKKRGDLWTTNRDGSHETHLVRMPNIEWVSWSPDGRRLRFTSGDPLTSAQSIWEIDADGRNLHQFLAGWSNPPSERHGAWSAGGQYFVFTSKHDGRSDVWIRRERSASWRRSPAGPFRLTDGPLVGAGATISPDGKRVFFCGQHPQFELDEFDETHGSVAPFLPKLAPRQAAFSRDGQWMAYVSSTHQLVRSRIDGSDQRLLTPPEMTVAYPRFSPDGHTIAFEGQQKNKPTQVYLVGPDGGATMPLVPERQEVRGPDWSADGRSLVVTLLDQQDGDPVHRLARVDPQSREASIIPGSQDFWAPRWSPSGDVIAATSGDNRSLNLFDVAAKQWHVVATGKDINIAMWSQDGRYLYYQDILSPGEPLYRVRPHGGSAERVAEFSAVLKSANRCEVVAIAPDDHLLVWITRANSDIYAAELR